MREYRQVTADGIATRFRVSVVGGNLHHWRVHYESPSQLVLDIAFPDDYPSHPPKLRILAPRMRPSALIDASHTIWCVEMGSGA